MSRMPRALFSWNVTHAVFESAAIAMYSGHVREFLSLPDDRQVVCAVSLGLPDPAHPANAFRTSRAALPEVVTVVD